MRGLRTVGSVIVTHEGGEVETVTAGPPCREMPLSGRLKCGSQGWLHHSQSTTVSHACSVLHLVPSLRIETMYNFLNLLCLSSLFIKWQQKLLP